MRIFFVLLISLFAAMTTPAMAQTSESIHVTGISPSDTGPAPPPVPFESPALDSARPEFQLPVLRVEDESTAKEPSVTHTLYASYQSAYVLQDIAAVADPKPGIIAGGTLSWKGGRLDGVSVDLWTRTALEQPGSYGHRGYGDEIDLTFSFDRQFKTAIGPVNVEASAAYFMLSDFKDFHDDVVQVYVQAGRPIKVAKLTITPYGRLQQWIGTGVIPNATFIRGGFQASVPVTSKLSLSGDLSRFFGLTEGKSNVTRAFAAASYDLGHGFNANVIAKFTEHTVNTYTFGFSYTF